MGNEENHFEEKKNYRIKERGGRIRIERQD